MGRRSRRKQDKLPHKLLDIRVALGLSQNELLKHLELDGELFRTNISSYELGEREPPLFVLLKYARAAGVCLDVLVDDELSLPKRIPSKTKH